MKHNITITLVAVVLAIGLIGGALALRNQRGPQGHDDYSDQSGRSFTADELAKFDGRDGRQCYVAVNGKIYKIEQGMLWQDGQHSTSEGQASCGRDLSEAIKQSPHGTSKLSALEVVGSLAED